jgi:Family of unknown function (DUF5372)
VGAPVVVTHPFHPEFGQELDFVDRQRRWGDDRVFYRSRDGQLASLPARWTSLVVDDAVVAAGSGEVHFRVEDLIALCALIGRIRR